MSHILPEHDLDLTFLYEIADGSDEFIIESIDMFLQQTPELLNAINTAITSNDWSQAASAAHKLKPNLGFFGMPISQDIMQEIELMTKEEIPDIAVLTAKFDEVNAIISANLIRLTKIKAEKEAGL